MEPEALGAATQARPERELLRTCVLTRRRPVGWVTRLPLSDVVRLSDFVVVGVHQVVGRG
jgi:hypothetical protein